MLQDQLSGSSLRLAKVTCVHPEGQSMDVIFLDSGEYGRDVMLMTHYGGTDFGFTSGLPRPEHDGTHEPNVPNDPDERHLTCVVALVNGRYIALGFVFPQVTHMAFKKDRDPDRMIERHTSDHYRTIDSEANFEQYHPGKAWFKIAEGDKLAHEDLTGRDFDGRWELTHNLERDPVILLHNESRTGGAFSEVIVQKGRILLQCVSASGVSSIEITPGTVTISASQEIVNLAPKIIEGTPSHITTGVHIDSNGVHTSGP